ncbi:MAG: T9SS type A sorting domain-containing protein [bacterium]
MKAAIGYLILFLFLFTTSLFSQQSKKLIYIYDNYDHLPVELVYFYPYLQNDTVVLYWGTATELNNYGFEIQRSLDTNFTTFDVLGLVDGHGTSYVTWNYVFYDTTLNSNGKFYYRLNQLDNDGGNKYSFIVSIIVTDVKDEEVILNHFSLSQNYPNPFNGETTIPFSISKTEDVKIEIFDINGCLITKWKSISLVSGNYNYKFNSENFSSGIYFYKLSSLTKSLTKKMILIK